MNFYKQLNEMIQYIELHLEEKIDFRKLSQILCCNPYVMQRMFLLLTNITVTDYIKKRRLSKSIVAILNNEKIIDIAIKYQYSSATSFSRAFKKMFGMNPKDIKKEKKPLNYYSILNFKEQDNNINSVAYRIEKEKGFNLYSIKMKLPLENTEKYTEKKWADSKRMFPVLTEEEIRFGIVEYKSLINDLDYHIASLKQFPTSTLITIPKSDWIVIKIDSFKAIDIIDKVNFIYQEFSSSTGFSIIPSFDLEIYYKDYVELWFCTSKSTPM